MFPLYDDNPTTRRPYLTVGLIVTCVMVFLWQTSLGTQAEQDVVLALGFIPALFFEDAYLSPDLVLVPTYATLVTWMFLHGDWMHLVGNMLFLWVFGNNIEDVCGHGRFIIFYVLCGLAAAFAQAIPNPGSEIPMIGASGAVSGVLGAYLVTFPQARVYVLIPFGILFVHHMPAKWMLGIWFVYQLVLGLLSDPGSGGVAFWAHVGGFVAGVPLIWILRDPTAVRRVRRPGRTRIPPTWTRSRHRGPWG